MRLAHDNGSLHTIAPIPQSFGHSNDPIAYLLMCWNLNSQQQELAWSEVSLRMGRGDGQIDSRERRCADTAGIAGAKWLFRAQAPVSLAMIPSDLVIRCHNAARFDRRGQLPARPVPTFDGIISQPPAASNSRAFLCLHTASSLGSRIHVEASIPFRKKGVLISHDAFVADAGHPTPKTRKPLLRRNLTNAGRRFRCPRARYHCDPCSRKPSRCELVV